MAIDSEVGDGGLKGFSVHIHQSSSASVFISIHSSAQMQVACIERLGVKGYGGRGRERLKKESS